MHTKLAVVGDVNGNGSIVLAATPPLKAVSVKKVGGSRDTCKNDRVCYSHYYWIMKFVNLGDKLNSF
ncbi:MULTISPECIES: hypothetical protein [Bacillus]|uniref:hypothetical protein n=1 Tax=Bacillus TaxID=1386 RepID=UPI000BECCFAE|nr:hypothetical protein [Bacillus thuringiensis]PDZ93303.1 hypothetical protein CON47_01870 [Bacillus thuringiensis]